jgi:hypothetical protein
VLVRRESDGGPDDVPDGRPDGGVRADGRSAGPPPEVLPERYEWQPADV